jgi:hypothetical protein
LNNPVKYGYLGEYQDLSKPITFMRIEKMSSELSAKQTQAALLLARGDTVTTTAEQVGVNRLTIHQLMLSSTNDVVRLNAAKEILDRAGLANDKPIGSDNVAELKQEREFGFSF